MEVKNIRLADGEINWQEIINILNDIINALQVIYNNLPSNLGLAKEIIFGIMSLIKIVVSFLPNNNN